MKEVKSIKLSKIDHLILYEMDLNCRQPLSALSKKLFISNQLVHYRFERLVKSGAIKSFTAVLDVGALGYLNYEVWVRLNDLDAKRRRAFEEYLSNNSRINWACVCSGEFDYMFDIISENPVDFYDVFNSLLSAFPDLIQNHFLTITCKMTNYSRDYLLPVLPKSNRRVSRVLSSGVPKKEYLDKFDILIIKELSANSRLTILELSAKAKISPNTVRSKIKILEKKGVIKGYRAILQSSMMNLEHYEIPISLQSLPEEKVRQLEAWCISNPNCIFMIKTVGTWDFNLVLVVENHNRAQANLDEVRTIIGPLIKEYHLVRIVRIIKYDYFTMPSLLP